MFFCVSCCVRVTQGPSHTPARLGVLPIRSLHEAVELRPAHLDRVFAHPHGPPFDNTASWNMVNWRCGLHASPGSLARRSPCRIYVSQAELQRRAKTHRHTAIRISERERDDYRIYESPALICRGALTCVNDFPPDGDCVITVTFTLGSSGSTPLIFVKLNCTIIMSS